MANLTAIWSHARVRRLAGSARCSAVTHHGRLRLSAAFLALSALGCDGLLDSDHPLTATITVDPAVLQRTDGAQINVTVTNQSTRPVTISTNTCGADFEIVDSTGTVVVAPLFSQVCPAFASSRILQPAESHVFENRWFRWLDFRTGDPLPSGVYRVRVGVFYDRRAARSAPVSITLVDAPN